MLECLNDVDNAIVLRYRLQSGRLHLLICVFAVEVVV